MDSGLTAGKRLQKTDVYLTATPKHQSDRQLFQRESEGMNG